jgi:hypothetical protein
LNWFCILSRARNRLNDPARQLLVGTSTRKAMKQMRSLQQSTSIYQRRPGCVTTAPRRLSASRRMVRPRAQLEQTQKADAPSASRPPAFESLDYEQLAPGNPQECPHGAVKGENYTQHLSQLLCMLPCHSRCMARRLALSINTIA